MSLPPDLQVLCRKLTSVPQDNFVSLSPVLVQHILRCGDALSRPSDQRPKDGSSESSLLVHKLKTQLSSLLNNGRNPQGRFVAAVLIKAAVDIGGWECLRTSKPWVIGLLSILQVCSTHVTCWDKRLSDIQKNDPFATKELCLVTLTRIYSLLQDYQTLIREIATPTLPDFFTACLQLVKQPASGKPLSTPQSLIETVAEAFAVLTPLYPTTIRPFSSQIRTAFKPYVAPTSSDGAVIPQTLRQASRRLLVLLHYTAPKNGNAEEWAKTLDGYIKASHATADQVFRAVQESWEPISAYTRQTVSVEGEPQGGASSGDDLPAWTGLRSGTERLTGLLDTLAQCFLCPTKIPVNVPLTALLDLVSRIALLVPPSVGSRDRDEVSINTAIGREERDELWSSLPDIHVAALRLLSAMEQRLTASIQPFTSDMLYQTTRVFNVNRAHPHMREVAFPLVRQLLLLHGPTMAKVSVGTLDRVVQYCCQDLLEASGFGRAEGRKDAMPENGTKTKGASSNADAYLASQEKKRSAPRFLAPAHQAAAESLLPVLFSHVPQQHLKQNLRGLLDRTAILTRNKSAMVASVLHPFRGKNGKPLPSILPFLVRQFPHDQEVEVLRSNLRLEPQTLGDGYGQGDSFGAFEAAEEEVSDETKSQDQPTNGWVQTRSAESEVQPFQSGLDRKDNLEKASEKSFFTFKNTETVVTTEEQVTEDGDHVMLSSVLKRKSVEVEEPAFAKRVDTGNMPESQSIVVSNKMEVDEDSDSEGSVQLDMTLDDFAEDSE